MVKALRFILGMGLALGGSSEASELTSTANLSVWGAGVYQDVIENAANPSNQYLKLPTWTGLIEVRPDVSLALDPITFTGRPRFRGTLSDSSVGDFSSQGEIHWSEAFVTYSPLDSVSLTFGLHNFQWGPAESASPSNRIFRDTVLMKDVLYDVKGKYLLRLNVTPAQEWSEVLMAELVDNGDGELEAEEAFARKVLLKSEYSWNGGAEYAALIAGWREHQGAWIGEYLNLELLEGLSFYFDASHQFGNRAWYPETVAGVSQFVQTEKNENDLRSFVVGGLRYSFESGEDLRAEWIYQQSGYNSATFDEAWSTLNAQAAAQSPLQTLSALRFRKSGLDFPGRNYGFASIRSPDFAGVKDWMLSFRTLVSAQDLSTTSYLSSENAIGQSGTAFAAISLSTGSKESELRNLLGAAVTLGYRHSW